MRAERPRLADRRRLAAHGEGGAAEDDPDRGEEERHVERLPSPGRRRPGKPVQKITRTKISQTWLASQTGPIERLISPRTRAPRSAPPAVRSQNPAPKSAPPSTA